MTDSTGNTRTWSAAILGLTARFGDPDVLFTWAEVDFIIRAMRAAGDRLTYEAGFQDGYRTRTAEENAAYPPEPVRLVTTAGQDAVRVHRTRSSVDVVEPREGDFAGLGDEAVTRLREEWAS